jgi:hypothetical protein
MLLSRSPFGVSADSSWHRLVGRAGTLPASFVLTNTPTKRHSGARPPGFHRSRRILKPSPGALGPAPRSRSTARPGLRWHSCGCPFNRSRGWRMACATLRLIRPFFRLREGACRPQAVKTRANKNTGRVVVALRCAPARTAPRANRAPHRLHRLMA